MVKKEKNILFYIKKLLPLIFIVGGGLFVICSGYIKWDFLKPHLNEIILYEYRLHIIWFIIGLIGISHYHFVGRQKKESKYVIIQTSMPFLDSLLSVLTYGTIINSCFFLADEVVNGEIIGLDLDWLSLFISVFIILFWSIKRLFDMGKQTWKSYIDVPTSQMTSVESTLISKIAYNENNLCLTVAFNNGSEYEYKNISQKMYDEFNKADSKGKYFHNEIRNKYEYEKIT